MSWIFAREGNPRAEQPVPSPRHTRTRATAHRIASRRGGRSEAAALAFRDEDFLVPVRGLHNRVAKGVIDAWPQVAGAEDFDGEIGRHFADNLDGIAVGQMGVPVESHGDDAVGINRRLVAAKLRDLADNGDDPALEAVEVRRGDAWRGQLLRHGCKTCDEVRQSGTGGMDGWPGLL